MTDPKTILQRAARAKSRIAALEEERNQVQHYTATVNAMDYSGVVVKHSSGRGAVEQAAIKLADRERKIAELIVKQEDYIVEARSLIDSLDSDSCKDVLYHRYILGESWEQVAVSLNYSWRHTMRLHGTALEALRKMS